MFMKKEKFTQLMNIGIIVFIVGVSFVLFGNNTTVVPVDNTPGENVQGEFVQDAQGDGLAQCLSEKGAVMYGTNWCGHCKNQKSMFGSSFEYVNFVNCDQDKAECSSNQVKGYPTWKINGQLYPGARELASLKQLSGC